ncbi:NAD(P)/FAD-dependent oxidoreductase [Mucilaginibacter sp. 14171R-50]|uniref:NAD(P)/FAD-dependent oxidoreductase n=1 Tax=Mucilaginibacter sp. 14171R-50 TaxID=2703789 RepID=UPI001EE49BD6|nr:NAD(P)/FAD-dependent oxidoreductase [Mucilaginibacter sp. 14171R-50]
MNFDVIIIGGSYAGLSAAMSLGRSLRNVLIIDSSQPCNRQTPHSHNLITHDGDTPAQITSKARQQVLKYPTVKMENGTVTQVYRNGTFSVITGDGKSFTSKKLLFATGVVDIMPDIPGFAECWGISVLHCPYCHGYEVRSQPTGIIANGDMAYEYAKMISTRTNNLTLFTNGPSQLTAQQTQKLQKHNIHIYENEIKALNHKHGILSGLELTDGSMYSLNAIYARPAIKQHCSIPQLLNCEITEAGFIKVDLFQATTVEGIFAAGDNANMFRSVARPLPMATRPVRLLINNLYRIAFKSQAVFPLPPSAVQCPAQTRRNRTLQGLRGQVGAGFR